MAGTPPLDRSLPDPPGNEPRLESWGEIAAYLHREIRTVQRWEKYHGLPVRRLLVGKLSTVYAYRSELDKWFRERQPQVDSEPEDEPERPTPADPDLQSSEKLIDLPAGPILHAADHPVSSNTHPTRDTWWFKLRWALAVSVFVVVTAGGAYVFIANPAAPGLRPGEKARLFVRPFSNITGNAEQDEFIAGLTVETITKLGRIAPSQLGVIAATASKQLQAKPIDELGRLLHVQYVLEGGVSRSADHMRIDVQLIQVSDQTHVWSDSYSGDLSDILRLQDDVTTAVASQIRAALPMSASSAPSLKPAPSPRSVNPEAYDAYLRGRFYWTNRADLHKSVEAFQLAIQKDPSYALAYAGLASAYAMRGQAPYDDMSPTDAKPKARQAAERALQLDPQLAEAHSVLANVSYSYDWNFPAAEKEFQQAFTLGPNDPTAHLWYSHYCLLRNRLAQAHEENSRTLELDPVSPLFNTVRAEIYYNARQYDQAIEQARSIVDQYPSYPLAYVWLGSAYREKKMFSQAIEQFSKARSLFGNQPVLLGLLGHALALSGDSAAARQALGDLKQIAQTRYVSSLYFAAVYTGLGDTKTALDWIDKAYDEHNDRLIYLNVDPIADPLRSEPRFRDLMAHLHLP